MVVGNVHASRAVQRSPVPVEGVKGPQKAENLHRRVLDTGQLGGARHQEGMEGVDTLRWIALRPKLVGGLPFALTLGGRPLPSAATGALLASGTATTKKGITNPTFLRVQAFNIFLQNKPARVGKRLFFSRKVLEVFY